MNQVFPGQDICHFGGVLAERQEERTVKAALSNRIHRKRGQGQCFVPFSVVDPCVTLYRLTRTCLRHPLPADKDLLASPFAG